MTDPINPLTAPALSALNDLRHGFFTRQGGVSKGLYASLNTGLGSRDSRTDVLENRARIQNWFGGTAFLTVHQHHSTRCVRTQIGWDPSAAPRADGIVTTTPGIVLAAQAADCGPVLFADPKARVIGAAHAGWKGALGGILEATIEAMEQSGADRANITAVLGPSISVANYEVGPEFIQRFLSHDTRNERFFSPAARDGHAMFDLRRYTLDRLHSAGAKASMLDRCTYAQPDLFFSYRRATHTGEADYGRLVSAIMLTHDPSTHHKP